MPKIGIPGVKVDGGGAEVQLPSLEGGLSAPDVKLLEGPDVSLKGPKVDLPSVNLSLCQNLWT